VEKRAQLKVKMEKEQQTQDLTDSKLLNEQQRSVMRELGAHLCMTWSIDISAVDTRLVSLFPAEQGLELETEKHKHTLEK